MTTTATKTTTTPDGPEPNLSVGNQFAALYNAQLRQLLRARKSMALGIVQLVPVLIAGVAVFGMDIDGATMFRRVVEYMTFPFIIPLIAIAYGGPAVVDEMEGRTLTYLTLRPLPKPVIYLGKTLANATFASALVLAPMLLMFLVCLGASSDLSETVMSLLKLSGCAVLGVFTYTAIFAALGALFATSLISSIVYFVVFEVVLAALPVLELLSVRYYMRTMAGFNTTARVGQLDGLIMDKPLVLPIWVGVLVACVITLTGLGAGAYIFKERQYYV